MNRLGPFKVEALSPGLLLAMTIVGILLAVAGTFALFHPGIRPLLVGAVPLLGNKAVAWGSLLIGYIVSIVCAQLIRLRAKAQRTSGVLPGQSPRTGGVGYSAPSAAPTGDSPDKFGRPLNVARPVRVVLGLVVLAGGILFAPAVLRKIAPAVLDKLRSDTSGLNWPRGLLPLAVAFSVVIVLIALGMCYVGIRLIRMKNTTEPLFGRKAALIGGAVMMILGVTATIAGLVMGFRDGASGGVFFVVMGYVLYLVGKRRKPDSADADVAAANAEKCAGISAGPSRAFGWLVAIAVVAVAAVLAVNAYRTPLPPIG